MPAHARDEETDVLLWRCKQLRAMGLPRAYVLLLAKSDADLHEMVDHLRRGATPDEVRRICL